MPPVEPAPMQDPNAMMADDMGDADFENEPTMDDTQMDKQPTGVDEKSKELIDTYNNLSNVNQVAVRNYAKSLEDSEGDGFGNGGNDDTGGMQPAQEQIPESVQRRSDKVVQEVMDELMNGRKKMKRPEKQCKTKNNPFVYDI